MASKELTAKVKLDIRDVDSKLKQLESRIKKINTVINNPSGSKSLERNITKAAIEQEKLKQATTKTKIAEEKLTEQVTKTRIAQEKLNAIKQKSVQKATTIADKVRQWAKNQNTVTSATRSTNSALGSIWNKVKGIASTYLGIMGMRELLKTSDNITSTQNRLNSINGGDKNLTQEQMDKMYASANRVRMTYTDMLANASKSMVLAGDAFQGNMDNAVRFQEIMAETYTLGGASAAEMHSSMYQMIQALGSGTLAGDELRSVREGAPLAYKAIEEFVQGVYDTEESLKELASQGKVTSDMVVAAIMQAGDKIDKQFEDTAVTFGQVWNRIKSAAVKAFEPVSNMLSNMLQRAVKNGALEKIESFFWNFSKVIQIVFQVIYNSVVWIADNWNWLKHILIAGLILYTSYIIWSTGVALVNIVKQIVAWMVLHSQVFLIIAALLTLVYIFYLWKTAAIDTVTAIGVALLAIALICGFIFGWWVALIVGIIGLSVMFFDYACGIFWGLLAVVNDILILAWNIVAFIVNLIVTIIAWCCVTIINLCVSMINGIMQLAWNFVSPFLSIIEFILNCCNGGFNSFGDACANLIGQIIDWFLSLGKVVTKIIDAIFGTNWTDGLKALSKTVTGWGKNENAITIDKSAPELERINVGNLMEQTSTLMPSVDFVNPLDAYQDGKKWRPGVKDSINDWGSKFQNGDGINAGGLLDNIGNKLGLDFGNLNNGFPNALDPKYDTIGAYNMPSNEELLAGIKDDTSDIKDSMDLTNDDLEFLRKIAEMEWRNEFTTAEIKVDMTNYNSVNGDRDLDGIVSYLSETLKEEMNIVASGVHV